MKLSYTWLKDYIDLKVTPEKLADILTTIGLEVKNIEKVEKDSIFEIEVTPNRPDCLSIIGIARELRAATGKILECPKTKLESKTPKALSKDARSSEISIEDKTLCTRYTARLITDVKIGASPKWLCDRLSAMGLRPVNNIVDITNFCLLEMGQPMHAFDFDKISGGKIIVRSAKDGESIVTIDGIKRKLEKGMLVIADAAKPIAIAGIMGGLDTEISAGTKNILLESAYFNPVSVRRTAFKLALSTESSYRFERGVDPGMILEASNRATSMIEEMAEGRIGLVKDVGLKAVSKKAVPLKLERLNEVLGTNIPSTAVRRILTNLGLMTFGSHDRLLVEIPSFRGDIKETEDLIEEIARISGYNNVPSTIPKIIEQSERMQTPKIIEDKAKNTLISLGIDEILTYSLTSLDLIKKSGLNPENAIAIKNPLSIEQEAMRLSLIPGMLNAVAFNINRRADSIRFFESGRTYYKEGNNFREARSIAIALSGMPSDWKNKACEYDFFDLKGIVEVLFCRLGIKNVLFEKADLPIYSKDRCAVIKSGTECLGNIGEISKKVLSGFDIKRNVIASEIFLEDIIKMASLEKRFEKIPRFPSVYRDISIVAGCDISSEKIISLVKEFGRGLVIGVKLIDFYRGKNIPAGSVGLSYRIEYQDKEKTLTDEEINSIDKDIKDNLTNKLSIKLR